MKQCVPFMINAVANSSLFTLHFGKADGATPTPESWVMQIKQRRETRHNVFNVKTKKSRHEENSLHDNADAGRADRIGYGLDEGRKPA